jgi:small subunit ribosomal protein S2
MELQTVENEVNDSQSLIVDPEIEAMMKAGIHLGHAKGKNHPAMQPYIFGVRNTVSVIDLRHTKEKLASALAFIKDIVSKGGMVLLVGTRSAARRAILEVAEKTKMPYFVERWIGGTLTNFREISRRVEYMETLEQERKSGEWEKYTKKEQLEKSRELEKLQKKFDGIRSMKRLPQAVFIVDIIEDATAVREARRMKIQSVALVDTNSNADLVDYPIPSNDDALPAVRYMVGRIEEAIEEGFKMANEKVSAQGSEQKTPDKLATE